MGDNDNDTTLRAIDAALTGTAWLLFLTLLWFIVEGKV